MDLMRFIRHLITMKNITILFNCLSLLQLRPWILEICFCVMDIFTLQNITATLSLSKMMERFTCFRLDKIPLQFSIWQKTCNDYLFWNIRSSSTFHTLNVYRSFLCWLIKLRQIFEFINLLKRFGTQSSKSSLFRDIWPIPVFP